MEKLSGLQDIETPYELNIKRVKCTDSDDDH